MIVSNLKKLMLERKITIRKMESETFVSSNTILKARSKDINKCRLYTLEAIARCLGCKVKDLFEEEN